MTQQQSARGRPRNTWYDPIIADRVSQGWQVGAIVADLQAHDATLSRSTIARRVRTVRDQASPTNDPRQAPAGYMSVRAAALQLGMTRQGVHRIRAHLRALTQHHRVWVRIDAVTAYRMASNPDP